LLNLGAYGSRFGERLTKIAKTKENREVTMSKADVAKRRQSNAKNRFGESELPIMQF